MGPGHYTVNLILQLRQHCRQTPSAMISLSQATQGRQQPLLKPCGQAGPVAALRCYMSVSEQPQAPCLRPSPLTWMSTVSTASAERFDAAAASSPSAADRRGRPCLRREPPSSAASSGCPLKRASWEAFWPRWLRTWRRSTPAGRQAGGCCATVCQGACLASITARLAEVQPAGLTRVNSVTGAHQRREADCHSSTQLRGLATPVVAHSRSISADKVRSDEYDIFSHCRMRWSCTQHVSIAEGSQLLPHHPASHCQSH